MLVQNIFMLYLISIGMTFGASVPWDLNGFPYVPTEIEKWTDIRNKVIDAQGINKSILDVGCGVGFSTSSSPECVGIDSDHRMLRRAEKLFPEKHFEYGDIIFWKPSKSFDIVTAMFCLHQHPRHIRQKILDRIKQYGKERIVVVDFSPSFVPNQEMCNRYPYLQDYLENCRDDMCDFKEHVIVKGKVHIWTLETGSSSYTNNDIDESMKQILRINI